MRDFERNLNLPTDENKQIPARPRGDGTFRNFGLGSCESPYTDAEGHIVEIDFPADPEELLTKVEEEMAADIDWARRHESPHPQLRPRPDLRLILGGE